MTSQAKAIASAINSARASNLVGMDDQIEELVRDYLWNDDCSDSDDSDSDSPPPDEDDGEEVPCGSQGNGDSCQAAADDSPLVEVVSTDPFVPSPDEAVELESIKKWTCGCQYLRVPAGDGRSGCIAQFSVQEVREIRLDWSTMSTERKEDMFHGVMLAQNVNEGPLRKRAGQSEAAARTSSRTTYSYRGTAVCRKAFKYLLVISQNLLTPMKKHILEHGAAKREKKTKPPRKHALTSDDVQRIVLFLRSYAEDHALVLPGRVKGISRSDIRLLPSSHTKYFVHQQYRRSLEGTGFHAVSLTSFKREWKLYCPDIYVTKPMTDLCWTCQDNNNRIQRSSNMSVGEKEALLKRQHDHLAAVTVERSYYNHLVDQAKGTVKAEGISDLQQTPSNSRDITMHYSFDYAQQVHLPSNPMQPGPMYFLVPRKVGIFGVCCEALPRQVNFLIDEGVCCGKGSNAVISYLDFFFRNFGVGEKTVELHCDNCAGQNKNQYLLQYLAWRVMTGQHTDVRLHFMLPGHTKFAPDWCFGLLKKRFRRCHVSCLEELSDVVSKSTHDGINRPQLVGDESGNVFVPTADWQTFFKGHGRPFPGIKELQHFFFSSSTPGICQGFKTLTSEPVEKVILNPTAAQLDRPPTIQPPGLSRDRQNYLYNNIRQFVKDEYQDIVCPRPQ